MRKNYFAKKFVAYSMAFAVAFSTLTVSPVFVKEAKAVTFTQTLKSGGGSKLSNGKFAVASVPAGNVTVPAAAFASLTNTGLTVKVLKATANAIE